MCKIIKFIFLSLILISYTYVFGVEHNSVYRISTYYEGNRDLTVQNSSSIENEAVVLWTNANVNAQRWRILDAGDGSYYIQNAFTEKNLLAQSNVSIVQNSQNPTNSHKWSLEPIEGLTDCYYIKNNARTGCLEVSAGVLLDEDGSPLRIFPQSESLEPRQIWKFEKVTTQPNIVSPIMRAEMMTSWKNRYFNWLKTSTGFWGEAECLEILLDAFETTGNEEYKLMFEEAYEHFVSYPAGWGMPGNGTDWMWNDFNDDVAWAVLASIRAYNMFGSHPNSNINYLNIAKSNFDRMYQRGLYKVDNLYYVLRWKQGQDGTTSCVNGPSEIAACYLAKATNDDTYYQKAKMLYDSQRIHMYEPSTGRVYDSFDNNWASAYNQGTYLGAAMMLYEKYGDEMYKKDAEKIVEFTMKDLCNSEGIITSVDSESGDYVSFKAILLRYVRRYIDELGKEDAGEWMQKNALRAYNNRNSKGLARIEWKTKTDETDNWSSIGCMASVAILMNAPLDVNNINKDAFSTNEAGSFSYISKAFSTNVQEGEKLEISSIEKDAYLGYYNIDCNQDYASGIELEFMNDGNPRLVEIRLGSYKGNILTTVEIPASNNTWQTISANFSNNLTGKKNIYFVFKGEKNNLKFKSFKFINGGTKFSQLKTNDITDDGGVLSSEFIGHEESEKLDNLIDNNIETNYLVKNKNNFWIQYNASMRYILTSYSISSADNNLEDPKNWTLYGSTNGNSWDIIDVQKNKVFSKRKSTINFSVETKNSYKYFKLQIENNNGATDTQLAEWQLFGEEFVEPLSYDLIEAGILTSEGIEQNEINKLSDNNYQTYCSFNFSSESTTSIVFSSEIAIQLQSYFITSSKESQDYDPKSWSLFASVDSIKWVQVDRRSNQTFESRALKKEFIRNNSSEYKYFRLDISETYDNSVNSVKLAEWELYGYSLDRNDLTSNPNGILTAQWEGKYKPDERIDERFYNLINKNKNTKYLASNRKTFWTVFQSAKPVNLKAYSLTSANDAPNRDPKNWTLYGSNNNSSWTVLDKRENQIFPQRQSTLYYKINSAEEFKYFKLDVEENLGEKTVQLAEWQLFEENITAVDKLVNEQFKIYPNPANSFINIDFEIEQGLIEIYNLEGIKVLAHEISNKTEKIPINFLPNGMYLINVKSKNFNFNNKFVKN